MRSWTRNVQRVLAVGELWVPAKGPLSAGFPLGELNLPGDPPLREPPAKLCSVAEGCGAPGSTGMLPHRPGRTGVADEYFQLSVYESPWQAFRVPFPNHPSLGTNV